MVTILSIPRSGTRFYMHFIMHVLGLRIQYKHFFKKNQKEIEQYLESTTDVIIVPVRSYELMAESFSPSTEYRKLLDDEFVVILEYFTPLLIDRGAHFMDIEKNKNTTTQFDNLLADLDIEWSPEINSFVDKWEKIGSQHATDSKSDNIVNNVTEDMRTLT